eukprot:CAMPEP_0115458530 /NCGR_PEP_ID=MMETSP0271-20121206/45783_1 /TAXON_ID=71861 /ORGANISM="Scrippsiella trochoidea, Strain CCMP3099" /LENGTH=36 /DNA_ID= /DNA_START= /DNA_END= /DNA_ORIENTATION=
MTSSTCGSIRGVILCGAEHSHGQTCGEEDLSSPAVK